MFLFSTLLGPLDTGYLAPVKRLQKGDDPFPMGRLADLGMLAALLQIPPLPPMWRMMLWAMSSCRTPIPSAHPLHV